MAVVASIDARRRAQYVVLQAGARPLGVLLLDPHSGRVWVRLREHWYPEEDDEIFPALESDLQAKADEMGGEALLASLEDTLSGALTIGARQMVEGVLSFRAALDQVFDREVEETPVDPYRTHLPLYSLRAAAGRFGEEELVEPEGWVRVPGRCGENLFVARVVGHSMEPRIPHDSLNVFRLHPAGSRQGSIVLAELYTELPGEGRYVVKRYTSKKLALGEDQWEHAAITLESVNPEYPPIHLRPEQLKRIVAEWVETVE